MEVWHLLITLGIVAFIFEIFTGVFISGAIGIGFFAAALANYLNLNVEWQIIAFTIGLAATFFLIRPFMLKYGHKESKNIKTNQDALIGRRGFVIEEVDLENNIGRVSIDGDSWRAKSLDDNRISEGTKIEVVNYESIILFVKPLN